MSSRDSTPSESSPLLSSPRNHLTNDDLGRPFSDTPDPEVFRVSRMDLIWVLAGLWSAVFLGALDGKQGGIASQSVMNGSQGQSLPH
jgi:hypothetical protein